MKLSTFTGFASLQPRAKANKDKGLAALLESICISWWSKQKKPSRNLLFLMQSDPQHGCCDITCKPKMVYSKKNPHPPGGWGRFLTPPPPLSPGFPEAQDPHSCLDFQNKRPPPPLPPGFPEKKILGLNLIYFYRKYAQSRLEDVPRLILKTLSRGTKKRKEQQCKKANEFILCVWTIPMES